MTIRRAATRYVLRIAAVTGFAGVSMGQGPATLSTTSQSIAAPQQATGRPTSPKGPYPAPTIWQQRQMDTFANDFGQLGRFRETNRTLGSPDKVKSASSSSVTPLPLYGSSIVRFPERDISTPASVARPPRRCYFDSGRMFSTSSQRAS